MNLNDYFDEEFSTWDNINKSILDPGKYTYRKKFGQLIDKNLDIMNIEKDLDRIYQEYATKQDLEALNKDITYMMNKVCKKIKGQRRGIPYSKEKVKRYVILQYQRVKLRQMQGKHVDKNKIEIRLKYIEIDTIQISIDQIQ